MGWTHGMPGGQGKCIIIVVSKACGRDPVRNLDVKK